MQRLFALTVVLKVGTAFLGWYLAMPWSLGFGVPLSIMGAYILIGLNRPDDDVSDEKFADTCYYLGFIFTITSIIFSLFDLPNIGTQIQAIAIRFGAAMVSTVFGLAVRVYLVSFRKDGADAVQDAEDAVVQAAHRFREQMVIAVEKLRDFEGTVDQAAKSTVERVNIQVEKLSTDYSTRLQAHFSELAQQNQLAFTAALDEVKAASLKLTQSFDSYSLGIQGNLISIEKKVTDFADAVSQRLAVTTFPDDYFAKHLEEPVRLLQGASTEVASRVLESSQQVKESSTVLSSALNRLKAKAEQTDSTLQTVLTLAATQKSVTEAAGQQLTALGVLTSTLGRFDEAFGSVMRALTEQALADSSTTAQLQALISQEDGIRAELQSAVTQLAKFVQETREVSVALGEKLDASTNATAGAADQAGLAAIAVSRVPSHIEVMTAATGKKMDLIIEEMAGTTEQLREMVKRLADTVPREGRALVPVTGAGLPATALPSPIRTTENGHPAPGLNPLAPTAGGSGAGASK